MPSDIRRLRWPVLALAVALLLSFAALLATPTALAADTQVPADASGPQWAFMDVTLLLNDLSRRPVLAVGGLLDDDVPLPAEVRLPIPEGAEVMWVGEIHGDTAAEDIALVYEIEPGDGYDIVVCTLTGSRRAQVEVAQPGALVDHGGEYSARMRWVAQSGAHSARYAIAMPDWAEVRSLAPDVRLHEGAPGVVYHYREIAGLTAGEELSLQVDFVIPGGAAQAATVSPRDPSILWGVVLIVGITGGVMMLIAYSSRRRQAPAEGPGPSADDAGMDGERALLDRIDDSHDRIEGPLPHREGDALGAGGHRSSAGDMYPDHDEGTMKTDEAGLEKGTAAGRKLMMVAIPVAIAAVAYSFSMGKAPPGEMVRQGAVVSMEISDAEPAAAYKTQVVIPCECPPDVEAQKLFDEFERVDGVSAASLDTESLLLEVSYDPASVTEDSIADLLARRGMLP